MSMMRGQYAQLLRNVNTCTTSDWRCKKLCATHNSHLTSVHGHKHLPSRRRRFHFGCLQTTECHRHLDSTLVQDSPTSPRMRSFKALQGPPSPQGIRPHRLFAVVLVAVHTRLRTGQDMNTALLGRKQVKHLLFRDVLRHHLPTPHVLRSPHRSHSSRLRNAGDSSVVLTVMDLSGTAAPSLHRNKTTMTA